MYFWNIEALKNDVRTNNFTDKDVLPYLIIHLTFYVLLVEFSPYTPWEIENPNMWDVLTSFAYVFIFIIGTIYLYKKNGGKEGVKFADKYFSIGFVAGIRLMIFVILPYVFIFLGYEYLVNSTEEVIETSFIHFFSMVLVEVIMYWYIGKHIQDT
jgi:magnesium-transporting ATPase (P-type)